MAPSAPLSGSLFQRLTGGFVSANSRPSAARTVALPVPTRGLRPLERWLCQCQLAAFGRSNGGFVSANSRPSAARTVALSVPTRVKSLGWVREKWPEMISEKDASKPIGAVVKSGRKPCGLNTSGAWSDS
ncbi:hypothetical protein Ddc_11585 [Ditylenchus destructor]|nr:hypothetical protein Ddc_11585 [Ditylenchus destructor]